MTRLAANPSPERSSHSYRHEKKPPQGIYTEHRGGGRGRPGREREKRDWEPATLLSSYAAEFTQTRLPPLTILLPMPSPCSKHL